MNTSALGVDKHLPVPLYFQLKESLRKRIAAREWKPGKKIPTEAEICQMYDVSRITVRKALDELQQEGYLEKRQGKGTFVTSRSIEQKLSKFYSFSEELKSRGLTEKAVGVSFCEMDATAALAEALHVEPHSRLYEIRRIRMVDDTPYAFEISYIPVHLAPGLTEEMVGSRGLYRSLAYLGNSVDNAVEKIRAVNLDKTVAGLLGVRAGEAGIYLVRTAASGSTIVEYCTCTVLGDFFCYTVELK